ncbi:ABC transporter substrate-binding protein [Aestuariispira insulae]|uniref:Peptide/nickel transport system substrate-binding protein n=1 Tax=Aestuariispira insulae TaxID=1461337 RepID=A0A3D9HSY4_9PROT|nr:ABC transporter substrate-binding protein [Aestuariispira insulae]RED52559.1 peptide/nickel transport system substrate-binding protein [Aestuariispira insulae]
MIKHLRTGFLTGIIATAITAAAIPANALERGGTLSFARYDDSTLIDPIYADRNPDIWMVSNLYDTLLRTGEDGKSLEPGLATGFEWSQDGRIMTLTLKSGLKFSDGSAITADDVLFSLERARNPELGAWSGLLSSVEKIEAKGDKVTLKLKSPDPALPSILATFCTAIMPKAAFQAEPGQTDQEKAQAFYANLPVGSGPFVLESHKRGTSMTLTRNPHYWRKGEDGKPLPYLDAVKFVIIPDDATRVLKLQAGEIDGAEFIPFSRVDELRQDPNLKVELFDSTRINYMPINTREKLADGSPNPLADTKVRQALNLATSKEALLKLVNYGNGKPMTSLMSSATQLHYGPDPLYPYDPAKAKALLAEAGYDNGFDVTITTLAGSADDATLFTALQQMWGAIGVKAKVEQVDNPTRGAKNRSGEFQIHTYGWVNDVNDPAQVTGWLGYYPTRKAVGTGWNDARFNKLFEASSSETDPAKRAAQYKEMQEIYAASAPLLFLYETPFSVALSKQVEGYRQSPLGNNEFSKAWLKR